MRLFPLLAAAGLAAWFIWWFTRTPPQQVAAVLRRSALWLGAGLLIVLAATGRLHWLFALLGALAPFVQRALRLLQYLPLLRRATGRFRSSGAGAGPGDGHTSQVRTRFLHVQLEHDSGAMRGQVLEGRFAGRQLDDLSLDDSLDLLAECAAADAQSAAVLEAYLDRRHGPEWRERRPPGTGQSAAGTPSGPMSRGEALEILGLPTDADKQAVLDAHRRLMQRLHPDRGGSTYLAAKINQAKDLLLNEG